MKRNRTIRIIAIVAIMLVLLGALLVLRAYVVTTGQIKNYRTYWNQLAEENEDAKIRYFALGDSSAQGVGASEPAKGYVGLLASTVQESFPNAQIVNLSVSGAKVDDVLQNQVPRLKQYKPSKNDIITLGIGSNNISTFNEESFTHDATELLNALPKSTIVSDVPYFGGGRARSGEYTANQASQIIRSLATARGMRIAELEAITTQNDSIRNYSADLFHPSNRAYALWAKAFVPYVQVDITEISKQLPQ